MPSKKILSRLAMLVKLAKKGATLSELKEWSLSLVSLIETLEKEN